MDFSKFKLDSGSLKENAELEDTGVELVRGETVESSEEGFGGVSGVTEVLEWNEGEVVAEVDGGGGEESLDSVIESGLARGFGGSGDEFLSQLDELLSDDSFEHVVVGGESSVVVAGRESGRAERPERSPGAGERREAKRVREQSKSRKRYRGAKRGLDSQVGERGPREYLVDGEGRLVRRGSKGRGSASKFEKLVELADEHGSVNLGERVRGSEGVVGDVSKRDVVVYPWSRPRDLGEVEVSRHGKKRGVVNEKELDFYRNLGASRDVVLRGELGEELRGRVSGKESRSEKTARLALVSRGVEGRLGKSGGGLVLKDLEVLQFLAKFKYATARQLSNLSGVVEKTALGRLQRLQGKGLVESVVLWGSSRVWVLTSAGMLLSGFDLPLVRGEKVSFANVGHQFVVNHVASNLWGGGVNVLGLDVFPRRGRVDSSGVARFGEVVVSETEIQSSFSKMRLLQKSEVYRPLVVGSIDRAFRNWELEGGRGDSPEFLHGNEYMWKLFPPFNLGLVYHDPDLVVARPRARDGKPRSIAVEVELNSKESHRYLKTLLAYKADKRLFAKVIWVCNNLQSAKSLESLSKEIGLWQEGRIDIVPVLTRDGVFEGRDLWLL